MKYYFHKNFTPDIKDKKIRQDEINEIDLITKYK